MRKRFQHELIGLSDDEAIDVIVEIAKLSMEYPDLWNVLKKCPFEGKQRDFFMYLCGYEIGLYSAKFTNCPNIRCCECYAREICAIARECQFFNTIRKMVKEDEEKAREYIRARLNTARMQFFDQNKEVI